MGLSKWIEQQLDPTSIDDRAVEARLEQFPTLRMSTAKLLVEYPQPKQQEKQAAARAARAEHSGEQRPGDAAVATIARDMSEKKAQEQTPDAESTKEDANAGSPMKQEASAETN